MTFTVDSVARVPPAMVAQAELSEGVWYGGPPWGSSPAAGTVLTSGSSDQTAWGSPQANDAQLATIILLLRSYLRMGAGWDTYSAPPVSSASARTALALLSTMRGAAGCNVVPTSRGGLQLEWHDGRVDVEIEILPSGDASLYAIDESEHREVERWVVPGHPAIDEWLGKLRRRG